MLKRNVPVDLYSQLGLATDRYQLTMGAGYFAAGIHEKEAIFHLFFRKSPFGGEYAISAGLSYIIDYLQNLRFTPEALEYLAGQRAGDGSRLFPPEYLKYLGGMENGLTVHAMPEGTAAFSHEPMVRVQGPIIQAQLVETYLLTQMNFQTLVATKAARIVYAAGGNLEWGGRPVLEFGARRAQGLDGAVTASRAAYIGGVAGTSNELAGYYFGIPVKGTHAHSWVMLFEDELEAFIKYGEALPNNLVFLVDTYDTARGVYRAVKAARTLNAKLIGIRLDSGDLAALSIEARKILDQAGYTDAKIFASNDLDEYLIQELSRQGDRINCFGVGTRLVTADGQGALGGVFKLGAVGKDGEFPPEGWRMKLSQQPEKTTNPGPLDLMRARGTDGLYRGDVISSLGSPPEKWVRCPLIAGEGAPLTYDRSFQPVLVPIFDRGSLVYDDPPLAEKRGRTFSELDRLPEATKRFVNPTPYKVALSPNLAAKKAEMMAALHGSG